MIEILIDYDAEMEKNPYLPYDHNPFERLKYTLEKFPSIGVGIQNNIDNFRYFNQGLIVCHCTICKLQFLRRKPNTPKCPFERNHKPNVDNRTIERMLS